MSSQKKAINKVASNSSPDPNPDNRKDWGGFIIGIGSSLIECFKKLKNQIADNERIKEVSEEVKKITKKTLLMRYMEQQ